MMPNDPIEPDPWDDDVQMEQEPPAPEPPPPSDAPWDEPATPEPAAMDPEPVVEWNPEKPPEPAPEPEKSSSTEELFDWRDVGIALKEAKGNRAAAAAALGVPIAYIHNRIKTHHILRSLWAAGEIASPSAVDLTTHREKDAPVESTMTAEEQVEMIARQDREIQLKGLKGLGVGDKMIEKLRSLDGMAKTSEKFLSVSVTTSYQMFAIQQIHLFEEVEEIRSMMRSKDIKPSTRLGLQKLYLEYTREINRGHAQQFQAAAALVQMMAAARGRVPEGQANKRQKKLKPGFTDITATPGE